MEIKGTGPYRVYVQTASGPVFVFNACFYETALAEAFKRAPRVTMNGTVLERPAWLKRRRFDQ